MTLGGSTPSLADDLFSADNSSAQGLVAIGTDLVRHRERSSGNWGIGGTVDAELE